MIGMVIDGWVIGNPTIDRGKMQLPLNLRTRRSSSLPSMIVIGREPLRRVPNFFGRRGRGAEHVDARLKPFLPRPVPEANYQGDKTWGESLSWVADFGRDAARPCRDFHSDCLVPDRMRLYRAGSISIHDGPVSADL